MSYQRTVLQQTDFFEVVSIEWTQFSVSTLHDHGWSLCSVWIESGIFEDRLLLGPKTELRVFEAGQVIHTPAGARHEIRCLSEKGKTLHVYTPKIEKHPLRHKFNAKVSERLSASLKLMDETRTDHLQAILREVRDESISTFSPFFMNQLFAGVFPQALMAEELISQTKTTLATQEASSVFSKIESEVVASLGRQIGWPEHFRHGVSVPGGSAANFMAVHCARQHLFPQFKQTGMDGKSFAIFVSKDAHYSFKKAAVALGLGTDSVVAVETDTEGRMEESSLEKSIAQAMDHGRVPLLIVATYGTTVKGAFDRVESLSQIAKKHGIWLHVDGAWGGPALFSKRLDPLVLGSALADSFTFDAHKLFGANLTCSFFLTQHPKILMDANDVSGGDYLFHEDASEVDLGKLSWQCGKRADATSFWTIWKSLGTRGLGDFVDHLLEVRDETIAFVNAEPRLQMIAKPEYLNLCLRVKPHQNGEDATDWSKRVRDELRTENRAMVNYANDEHGSFLRLIFAHPELSFAHVRQILQFALEVR